MGRGQGLENIKEFNWVKQPNGRYTIFDVPIFGVFDDNKRGSVGTEDLHEAIVAFEENKNERSHYPRIHIGHHEKVENRQGAGYLDNLQLRGDTIYADLVEIIPEVFEQIIQEMKFPYVSSEYNPEKKQITSLALLESQSPYFKYPLLALSKEPQESVAFQQMFSVWEKRSDSIMKFQERENMEEEKKDKKEDESSVKEEFCDETDSTKDTMIEDKSKNYNCQEEMGGLREMLQRVLSMIEEIHAWEKEEHSEGAEETDEEIGEPSEPMLPEENEMSNPSSVAYQENALGGAIRGLQVGMNKMQQEISAIGRRVVSNGVRDRLLIAKSRLRQICEDRGLNFQSEYSKLQKFSSDKDRMLFMDTLELIQPPSRHPAGRMVQKFMQESPREKILRKYQGKGQSIATKAYDTYIESLNNAVSEEALRKFQAQWPTIDKFVDFAVNNPAQFEYMLDR